jgi:SAM-dependent methyltransferase
MPCLACGEELLTPYFNLGDQPLANSYSDRPDSEVKSKVYPLMTQLCVICSHSQLTEIVPPEVMFKNYLYVSGTTETLRRHFERLAQDAIERGKFVKPNVLDIGCNDGTLLECFKDLACGELLGIDPAENLAPLCKEKGIEVISDFWNANTAQRLQNEKGRLFDIVTACNVFAHNQSPRDFLKAVKFVLSSEGMLVIEFPYGKNTIQTRDQGQFYHEHINYFTVKSFTTLAYQVGFEVLDVLESAIHGGSIRFYLRSGTRICDKAKGLIELERVAGSHEIRTYRRFDSAVQDNWMDLARILDRCETPIIGYGAGAKTTVLLNSPFRKMFDISKIAYVVDDNPLKHFKYIPGTDIQIIPPGAHDISTAEVRVTHLLFIHNFKEEIVQRLRRLDRGGDCLINYVPIVTLETI